MLWCVKLQNGLKNILVSLKDRTVTVRIRVLLCLVVYLFVELTMYFIAPMKSYTMKENNFPRELRHVKQDEGILNMFSMNIMDNLKEQDKMVIDCPSYYYTNRLNTVLLHAMSKLLMVNVTVPFFLNEETVQNVQNTPGNMTCVLSDDGVDVSYILEKHNWPDLNVDNLPEYTLMLYLAMCDISNMNHFTGKYSGNYYLIAGQYCFLSESTKDKMQKIDITELALMQVGVLCKLRSAPILIEMDDISSHVSSLGKELTKLKQTSKTFSGEGLDMILEEVDGRLGKVVSFLRDNCQMYNKNPRKSVIHRSLEAAPIITFTPYFKSNSVSSILTVKGGYKGYMKMNHPTKYPINKFINQGAAEILGHWIDRIVGWYRTPVVVIRKLSLTQLNCTKWKSNGYDCEYENITSIMLPGMAKPNQRITKHYRRTVLYDSRTKSYFVYVCIIATIKDSLFHERYSNKGCLNVPYREYMGRTMNEYFGHRINYRDLLHEGIHISKQRLRDISDIHIADFITVNEDRVLCKNWVFSGLRFINFDNGMSFQSGRTGRFHNYTLTCIPLFCYDIKAVDLSKENNFCRFNRDTIIQLEKVGPKAKVHTRLGRQLQIMIKMETKLCKCHFFDFEFTKEQSINSRVEAVLNLHHECFHKYGKTIYI